MTSRESFVKQIRKLGYTFKTRCKSERNEMWRKKGSTHCIFVPRSDALSDIYVKTTLRDCGMSPRQIEALMKGDDSSDP